MPTKLTPDGLAFRILALMVSGQLLGKFVFTLSQSLGEQLLIWLLLFEGVCVVGLVVAGLLAVRKHSRAQRHYLAVSAFA